MLFDLIWENALDAVIDSVKILPFLFAAFYLLELLEHYAGDRMNQIMRVNKKAGPVIGALVGCVPQCGFSAMASNFYAGGIITVGTLLSVFLSTSDEAILILMGHPDQVSKIGPLILCKVLIGIAGGFVVDTVLHITFKNQHAPSDLCKDCGCHSHGGILKPALRHTVRIFAFLLVCNLILNLIISVIGIDQISKLLLHRSVFQPFIAALLGLIPNCAASVLLTELYLNGILSFASVIAGLSAGAGTGIIVLFKMNNRPKENIMILVTLYIIAVASGIVLSLF